MIPSAVHSSEASSSVTTCRLVNFWLASKETLIGPPLAARAFLYLRRWGQLSFSTGRNGSAPSPHVLELPSTAGWPTARSAVAGRKIARRLLSRTERQSGPVQILSLAGFGAEESNTGSSQIGPSSSNTTISSSATGPCPRF